MREMKDSGIEWIGEIPKNWEVEHLKYLCTFKTGGTPNNKIGINCENSGYPWVTAQDITDTLVIYDAAQYIDENAVKLMGYELFPIDSILLVCIASVGKVGIITRESYANQQITALKPNGNKIVPKYLLYSIKAGSEQIIFDASSNVVPIVNTKYLSNYTCMHPDIFEQKRIADFLDEKCTEIDNLTADIQKQIDTLEQYKKSVITEAVTKGLNPDVEMKDSGVEWIGEIPKEWKRKRLVHLISSERYAMVDGPFGSDMKNEEYVDEGVPIIQLTNIKPFNHYIDELKFITEEKHQQLVRHTARKGDIAIAKMMPAGRACILSEKYNEYVVAADAIRCVIDEGKADKRFVVYCLNSYCMSECEIASKGTTRVRISLDIARRLTICVPTLNYQIQIADYLDERCSEIDTIISDKKKQLVTLEQYKKSLIYEYVTGKKEVLV